MSTIVRQFAVMFLVFLLALLTRPYLCVGASISGCIDTERTALLNFKEGLKEHTKRLSSWIGEDCCRWEGVVCNNRTWHVVRLDLRNPHPLGEDDDLPYNRWSLRGEIRPSLLGLKHLSYLDLSMNYFRGIRIPEFIGSFRRLSYLNLSRAGMGGPIPQQLGNLSSLKYLDLSNDLDPSFGNLVREFSIDDDALWLSGLTSLQHLFLKSVNFGKATYWLQALNMLPSIVEISLPLCEMDMDSISLSLPFVNFTSLSILDLSDNSINSTVPAWLFNISSLEYLDLSSNLLHGFVPAAIGNLTSLTLLDMSFNPSLQGGIQQAMVNLCKLQTLAVRGTNISRDQPEFREVFTGCMKSSLENLDLGQTQLRGYLPDWLGQLIKLKSLYLDHNLLSGSVPPLLGRVSSLQILDLSGNMLNGTIPTSLGWLSELVKLDLGLNLLEGTVSEAHLANLTRLTYLDLSSNLLVMKVRPKWVPSFRLETIMLGSCKLGPRFPTWLRTQRGTFWLDISQSGILDSMPEWFWSTFSLASYLDLSDNGINGRLPDLSNFTNLDELDLSSNYFEGQIPVFPSGIEVLILSNNSFSGSVLGDSKSMANLMFLSLSTNNLSGDIPLFICELKDLVALDLSKNMLSGELPNCWNSTSDVSVLDFASNNLSGGIPESIFSLSMLQSLHLRNNSLSGELPLSLKGCQGLTTLDLGNNRFIGNIPAWIGESSLPLKILSLRSNMFDGNIPPTLSRLGALQILDLSDNNLSGSIPRTIGNFNAMKVTRETDGNILIGFASGYQESLRVTMKGRDLQYDRLLPFVIIMDLSGNNLSGEIPEELTSLYGLLSLNLSGNHLTGVIPEMISRLQVLESLDLSRNNLHGTIPSGMIALTSLGQLNLSHNLLSGRIPSGNQFNTFVDPSIFAGNPGLCGFPLPRQCKDDQAAQVREINDVQEDDDEIGWLYMGLGTGFAVGVWVVWGALLCKKSWKDAYFRFTDNLCDKVYAAAAVNFARLKARNANVHG